MKDSQVLDSGVVVEGAAAGALFCVADGLAGALTTATLGTTVLIEGAAELASAGAATEVLELEMTTLVLLSMAAVGAALALWPRVKVTVVQAVWVTTWVTASLLPT